MTGLFSQDSSLGLLLGLEALVMMPNVVVFLFMTGYVVQYIAGQKCMQWVDGCRWWMLPSVSPCST